MKKKIWYCSCGKRGAAKVRFSQYLAGDSCTHTAELWLCIDCLELFKQLEPQVKIIAWRNWVLLQTQKRKFYLKINNHHKTGYEKDMGGVLFLPASWPPREQCACGATATWQMIGREGEEPLCSECYQLATSQITAQKLRGIHCDRIHRHWLLYDSRKPSY